MVFSCHRVLAIATAALLFALPACGGDDDGMAVDAGGGDGTGGDGTGGGDGAGGDDGTDAGAACPFAESLGALSLTSSEAQHRTQPPAEGQEPDPTFRALVLAGAIEGASASDFLTIELWDDYGPFAGSQLAAGEFSIEGDDTTPQDCGVCVSLLAGFGDDDESNDVRYFAGAGTVTVDSAGTRAGNEITGNFTGSLSGVTLTELDPESGAPVEGGCTTTIDEAAWDTPIENGDSLSAAGAGGNARPQRRIPLQHGRQPGHRADARMSR
ncbi:MAG TPA: hypothetical protein VKB80_11055 [Kofleriaceae bacterium]|nr:hypothetical protein [Kofleriaceae bacterium]